VDVIALLVTDPQSAEFKQPSKNTFHNPAMFAQTTAVFRMSLGDQRLNAAPTQRLADFGFGIIGSIRKHFFRSPSASPIRTPDRRHSVDQRDGLLRVVDVGRRVLDRQRDPRAIAGKMPFRPIFAAIRRIWSGLRPPKTARTEQLSKINLFQSISSAKPSWSSKIRQIFCHTPAWCQSRKRRQHVMPLPQPNSLGNSSQGQPVRRINRMPVSAARFDTGGRPPLGLATCAGITGSMIAHSSSSSNGLAIECSSLNKRRLTKTLAPNNRFC